MSTRITEIKARLAATVPGPWNVDPKRPRVIEAPDVKAPGDPWSVCVIYENLPGDFAGDAHAAFIANAPADLTFLLAEVERLSKAKADLIPCKSCRGLGGLTQTEHDLIAITGAWCSLNRYADASTALGELRRKFAGCAFGPELESMVQMIDRGAVGDYYASGGTLGRRAVAPPFTLPVGFTRPAGDFHMTLLDIADSKLLRVSLNLSGRLYEKWLDVTAASPDDLPGGEPVPVGIGYAEQGENAVYFEVWEWPEAQAWRAMLGLGPKDLHITLGVKGANLHGGPKDRTTLVGTL